MCITTRLIRKILISFILLLLPLTGGAGIYKWVDENGKVHYTDKKPKKAQGKAVETDIRLPKSTTRKGMLGTKVATQLAAIRYPENLQSRRIRMEKLIIDLENDNGGSFIIGHEHNGAACTRSGGGFTWSRGRSQIEGKSYRAAFSQELKSNNYQVVDGSERLFAEQKEKSAELSIAAVITHMEVNRCHLPYKPNSFTKRKQKVASYVKVKWSVFDVLERKIVFEAVSEGSDAGLYESDPGNAPEVSRIKSFKNAVTNFLSKEEFSSLMKPVTVFTGEIKTGQVTDEKLAVKLIYGNRKTNFTQTVARLKLSTVTIRTVIGHGSGFILSEDGYVITNAHVVGDSAEAIVVLNDGERRAEIIKVDERRDVALLKLHNSNGVDGLKLAIQAAVEGEPIYIIGTPLNERYHHTVTQGIISSYRTFEDGNTYYQTDAAINPGNSGGPVFSQHAEVIGIAVSGLVNRQGNSLDINFLIPISDALVALGVIN